MWCGVIVYGTTGRYVRVPGGLCLGALLRKILLIELCSWGKGPPICFWLNPYSFKIISEKKSRSQTALLTLSSSTLKILTGTVCCFLKSMQNSYFHEKMPSSIWETHLGCTCYCCAQEHLLLIRGIQLSLQSKALVQTDFSSLPSGLSSWLEFSRCRMVFTQRKDHLHFADAQRNKTLQMRADFSSSPFLPWCWSWFCGCAKQIGRGCWPVQNHADLWPEWLCIPFIL